MPREITKTVYSFQELLDLRKAGKVAERALDRAREWLKEAATSHDWWEYEYSKWEEALAQIGFEDVEISFSGFWSQGDGSSFTTKNIDLAKLIDFLSTKTEPRDSIAPSPRTGKEEDFWPYIVHATGGVPVDRRYRKLWRLVDYIDGVEVERIDSHYAHWNTCRFRADLQDRGDYKPPEIQFELGKPVPIPGKAPIWHSRTPRVRKLFEAFREDAEELRKDICRAIYKDLEEEYEYRVKDESLAEDAEANDWTFDIHGEREG